MNMKWNTIILSIIILVVFNIYGFNCKAEEIGKQYTDIFINKMNLWDEKKLRFVKKDLAPLFANKLKYRLERRVYGYEDNKWYAKGMKLWGELPQKLDPKLKLSRVSRSLLYTIFLLNIKQYHKYVSAKNVNVSEDLDLPFFTILGVAQPLALMKAQKQIYAYYIGVALEKYEDSYHWPSCPPPPPPGKNEKKK